MEKWQGPREDNIKFDFTLDIHNQNIKEAAEHLVKLLNLSERHKHRHVLHLGLIIQNLVIAHKRGDRYRLSYPRGRSFYSSKGFRRSKHLNPRGISYLMLRYIGMMERNNLVVLKNGFFSWEGKGKSFNARMQPTDKFVSEIVVPFGLYKEGFISKTYIPPILVKEGGAQSFNIEAFFGMAEKVKAYNDCYEKLAISIDDPRYDTPIVPEAKCLYRVFNQGSLEKGGRFYGGWWQQKSGKERSSILLDGERTIELDYSGAHIGLLYGLAGVPMPRTLSADPYLTPDTPRDVTKLCVLLSINNPSPGKAWNSVRQEMFLKGEMFTRAQYDGVMESFFNQHMPVKELFFREDLCLTLQYLDSVIADRVMEDLIIKQRKPVLPIHDSFIVKQSDKDVLHTAMVDAYTKSDSPVLKLAFTSIKDKEGIILL